MSDNIPKLTPAQAQAWHDFQRKPHTQDKYWGLSPISDRPDMWGKFYQSCFDTGCVNGLPRHFHESFDGEGVPTYDELEAFAQAEYARTGKKSALGGQFIPAPAQEGFGEYYAGKPQ